MMKGKYSNLTELQLRNKYNKKILKRSRDALREEGQLEPKRIQPYLSEAASGKTLYEIENLANAISIFSSLINPTLGYRETAEADVYGPPRPRPAKDVSDDEGAISRLYNNEEEQFINSKKGKALLISDPAAYNAHLDKARDKYNASMAKVPRVERYLMAKAGTLLPPANLPTVTTRTKESLNQLLVSGEKILGAYLSAKKDTKELAKSINFLDQSSVRDLLEALEKLKAETAGLLDKFPNRDAQDFKITATAGISLPRAKEMQSAVQNVLVKIFEAYKGLDIDNLISMVKSRQFQVGRGLSPQRDEEIPLRYT